MFEQLSRLDLTVPLLEAFERGTTDPEDVRADIDAFYAFFGDCVTDRHLPVSLSSMALYCRVASTLLLNPHQFDPCEIKLDVIRLNVPAQVVTFEFPVDEFIEGMLDPLKAAAKECTLLIVRDDNRATTTYRLDDPSFGVLLMEGATIETFLRPTSENARRLPWLADLAEAGLLSLTAPDVKKYGERVLKG